MHPFDHTDPVAKMALYSCIQKRWHGCLKALLDRGVDPAKHTAEGYIPLLTACKMKEVEALKMLIRAGAKDLVITTAASIFMGYESCFEQLWKHVPHTADLVRTCGCMAAMTNNIKILRIVLKAEKPDMLLHRYGRKVRSIIYTWCNKLSIIRNLPQLQRRLDVDDISVCNIYIYIYIYIYI